MKPTFKVFFFQSLIKKMKNAFLFFLTFFCISLGTPPVLSIPILQPCLRSEQLLVTIDTHTGVFTVHVPQYEDNPYVQDIQQCLNEDKSRLETLVSQLRFWVSRD